MSVAKLLLDTHGTSAVHATHAPRTGRSHSFAGQLAGLLHPSGELSFVDLVALMDVEVAHLLLLGLAEGDRTQRRSTLPFLGSIYKVGRKGKIRRAKRGGVSLCVRDESVGCADDCHARTTTGRGPHAYGRAGAERGHRDLS